VARPTPRRVAATIGAMRPTPAELAGGSSAHREGEGYRSEHQAGRRAAGVRRSRMCRAGELGGARLCARAMGKNISRPKQVTDWVARLEKLEQMLAAESGSGLLVQPAWIEKNVPDRLRHQFIRPENSGLPLSQVQRLVAADRGWGSASAHLEAEGHRIPGSSRWVLTTRSTRGIASACPFSVPSH